MPLRPAPASPLWRLRRLLPGVVLAAGVAVAAEGLARMEALLFGQAWLGSLVLAILLGTAVRTARTPSERWTAGIAFSARTVLEVAVLLLGAAISTRTLADIGLPLVAGVAAVVVLGVIGGYGLCRMLGLAPKLALLVACGNAICGNSAIAAVAPVIGAGSRDVAASIAFTAILGVAVVVLLPLAAPLFGLTAMQYGALAGLTVYAVPQVLAAAAPLGAVSIQVGTLVKLVRVLMLGPLVVMLSLAAARRGRGESGRRLRLRGLVPWFIVGFVILMAANSAGLLPPALAAAMTAVSGWLTVIAMAALGLGVDIRTVARAGPRVSLAVTLSLLGLTAVGLVLVRLLLPG